MTEMFEAVRDALQRVAIMAYTPQRMPDLPRPWYLPEAPPQTVGQYRAALGKLGKLGIVRQN